MRIVIGMNLQFVESAELSDIGRKRTDNQDACLRIPEKGVYCVADGIGGVSAGELASAAIIDGLRKTFAESSTEQSENFSAHVTLFHQATNAANKWILDYAAKNSIGQTGSTLVALVFDPNNPRRAVGLHAGDSRLYVYRSGGLIPLTVDHTAASAFAARWGGDAAKIPERLHNQLVKAIGLGETVELERNPIQVASGDIFLLCSDGLTRMLSEEIISDTIKNNNGAALPEIAQTLIAAANEAGGRDNVTVILVRMGNLGHLPTVFEAVNFDECLGKSKGRNADC